MAQASSQSTGSGTATRSAFASSAFDGTLPRIIAGDRADEDVGVGCDPHRVILTA
jgi:hypothetical protein